jgi:hypothetical protein
MKHVNLVFFCDCLIVFNSTLFLFFAFHGSWKISLVFCPQHQQLLPFVGMMFLFSSNNWVGLMGLHFLLLLQIFAHPFHCGRSKFTHMKSASTPSSDLQDNFNLSLSLSFLFDFFFLGLFLTSLLLSVQNHFPPFDFLCDN